VPQSEALSVAWTMEAIEMLAFEPLSAPQVAAAMGIHPRTARRMLNRLRDEGYLELSDDGRRLYSPTLRVVSLAGQIVARHRLVRIASAFVAPLAERTGTPAQLCIPSYRSVLAVLDTRAGSPAEPRVRELLPAHCTAGGKALLAWRHPWRDSVLGTPLHAFTDRTLTDPRELSVETDVIRRQGYATEYDEFRTGRRAAAAPVFLPDGDPMATLSATATDEDRGIDELVPAVVEAAATLTRRLEEPDA
jgi:DNA-binding IclR family transcriptional regulator